MAVWDILMVVAVTLHAGATAYIARPRGKALMLAIPLPFSLAYLAVGTHVHAGVRMYQIRSEAVRSSG